MTKHYTQLTDDKSLQGCQLVRFVHSDEPIFGLSCKDGDTPMSVCLFEDQPNVPGPILITAKGDPVVSFGPDFVVGFDPRSTSQINAKPKRGDLMIYGDALQIVVIKAQNDPDTDTDLRAVNLDTGEIMSVTQTRPFALIHKWSISINSWCDKQRPVRVFKRPRDNR